MYNMYLKVNYSVNNTDSLYFDPVGLSAWYDRTDAIHTLCIKCYGLNCNHCVSLVVVYISVDAFKGKPCLLS